ncbi:T9SS type A sorting domain-containing protein [Flavobacterium rakeshii]|uniref:T9SS type A sorting domain-containing protein n=1 Tax=Flavobacterium rakeshii TaxID=1038845 RepID=UPI002E7C4954|nr:T9SS type A sorting domain-containing protein [Flavobacterium rakeshii]MEE1898631.1 T9SS type A sorting domain-containing protein [Flavobacterium rakeshii]
MKKNLLLAIFTFITFGASAQIIVWEDDFNDADVSDWTLIDVDENSSNWMARKNLQISNEGLPADGEKDIFGTYNIDMSTGGELTPEENNWAISPAIDLSFYEGSGELIINAQSAIYGGTNFSLPVYISESSDIEEIMQGEPVIVNLVRGNNEGDFFEDYTIDISEYIGLEEVYIVFTTPSNMGTGVEIDKVTVTAQNILDIKDVAGTMLSLKQNPVEDYLLLSTGNQLDIANTSVLIYNTTGSLVKQSGFMAEGMYVGDVPSGVYFMVVTDGLATEKLKFIKK